MSRKYHSCHFCTGNVSEQQVTVDYRWGEELIALVRNVPAGICQICGERYFKAEIIRQMEQLVRSNEKPEKTVEVPVRELPVRL